MKFQKYLPVMAITLYLSACNISTHEPSSNLAEGAKETSENIVQPPELGALESVPIYRGDVSLENAKRITCRHPDLQLSAVGIGRTDRDAPFNGTILGRTSDNIPSTVTDYGSLVYGYETKISGFETEYSPTHDGWVSIANRIVDRTDRHIVVEGNIEIGSGRGLPLKCYIQLFDTDY